MPGLNISEPTGVVKIGNERGPKTDPCGTPVLCVTVFDLQAPWTQNLYGPINMILTTRWTDP